MQLTMQDLEQPTEMKNGTPREKDATICENLDYWMSRLPPSLRTLPINHLAIPGSHDTMTYTITRKAQIGPDGPKFLKYLGCLSVIAKPTVFNWSITQHDDVKAQLDGGIRYLDLRTAGKPETEEVYFLHGLYGADILQPLEDIADWLSSHTGEVVILDFQHFYEFNDAHHRQLIGLVQNLFKEKLCPVFGTFAHISLDWLALEKYQVIVIYRNIAAKKHMNLWPGGMWPTPWADTVNVGYLINFLNEKINSRSLDLGFISQCLLTPDTSFVLKHLCGSLERDLVTHCRYPTLAWINEQYPGNGGLNIVISDFVSYDNFRFSRNVIQRNTEMLTLSNSKASKTHIEVQSKS